MDSMVLGWDLHRKFSQVSVLRRSNQSRAASIKLAASDLDRGGVALPAYRGARPPNVSGAG